MSSIFITVLILSIVVLIFVLSNFYVMIKDLKRSDKELNSKIFDINIDRSKTRKEIDYIYLKSKILPLGIKNELDEFIGHEDYVVSNNRTVQKNDIVIVKEK